MSYPATRRFFRDDEFRNEAACIAGLVRSLAQWENYAWGRDLTVTPADSKIFDEAAWPWAVSGFESTPVHSLTSGQKLLAVIPVPDPRAPATKVAVHLCVTATTAGLVRGDLTVLNSTTGISSVIHMSTVLAAGGNYWMSTTVEAAAGDVLQVYGWDNWWGSGPTPIISSICAWWDPTSLYSPGVNFGAGWSSLSQAFHSSGQPLSTYALRWVGRMANEMVAGRPMPVAASWLYNPAAGTGAGYSTVPLVVGRYKVPIGERIGEIYVRLRYRASGACSVTCALSGGGSASVSIPAAGSSWATTFISRTAGAFSVEELTLTVAGSPTYCDIEHVLVYEGSSSASMLALPAGETVPAYDPNLDERISSGKAIRADDAARLVANMVAIWGERRNRVLVNDCRFTYKERLNVDFPGVQGALNKVALHAIVLKSPGGSTPYQTQVRAGWHGYSPGGASEYTPIQVGVFGTGDYAGSPAVGAVANTNATVNGQANWQHRWGSAPGSALVEFETHLVQAGASIGQSTRPSWLVLEQLPINSPSATYP